VESCKKGVQETQEEISQRASAQAMNNVEISLVVVLFYRAKVVASDCDWLSYIGVSE